MMMIRKISSTGLIALSFIVAACGGDTPEDRLQSAADEVASVENKIENVSEEIDDARSELEKRRAEVRDAEQALASARQDLRKLQKRLATEQKELDSTASDTAIFRLLQSRLLEDDLLASEAINLFVLDGTVVLYGEVRSEEQKKRAGSIAADVPGVTEVRNFVEFSQAEANPGSTDS